MKTSSAYLLKKSGYGETSLVITWLTETDGKIQTVAKGAFRPKSALAGRLDWFQRVEIGWLPTRKGDLHILGEAVLQESHAQVNQSYTSFLLAGYFLELIDISTEIEHPAGDLFDLLSRALGYLNIHGSPPLRALDHFESELARLLGVAHERKRAGSQLAEMLGRLPSSREPLAKRLAEGN